MGDKTGIEWADATWNPVRAKNYETGGVGHYCEHVSDGCRNCYAERMQPRFKNDIRFRKADRGYVNVFLDENTLDQPMRWSRPRIIFPCSMTDIAGEWVTVDMLDQMFTIMAFSRQHIFQVLTKRIVRLKEYLTDPQLPGRLALAMGKFAAGNRKLMELGDEITRGWSSKFKLRNVWIGTSVEDQKTADERIPHLLRIPAVVRWLSAEPLLGLIDLHLHRVNGIVVDPQCGDCGERHEGNCEAIDWVVGGGESGPRARPMNPHWARDLRDQCEASDVPFFFKQFGEYTSIVPDDWPEPAFWLGRDGRQVTEAEAISDGGAFTAMYRVGKHNAGRELDGRFWDEMPEVSR